MQEPEPIDWEYYRKGIGSRLVDMYKEAYDSMFSNSLVNAPTMYVSFMGLLFVIRAASSLEFLYKEGVTRIDFCFY